MVNVTFCPTAGVLLSTVFWMPTSAAAAVFSVAAALSLLVSGSGSLAAVLVAMLVSVPACVTCTMRVSVAPWLFGSVPTAHQGGGGHHALRHRDVGSRVDG